MDSLFWGFCTRFGQAALEATLTLLIGVVTAGIMRRMLTPQGTRRLFRSGWVGLFRGWLAGMLLPVCSLGVIPVAREMRRSGVPGGTVLAFVLAAPLLNPISFLYGLTLAEPKVILCFAGLSLLVSTLAGWLWDRWFAPPTETDAVTQRATSADAAATPPVGLRRMLAVLVTATRELAGRDLWFYLVGLVGTALLATLIPHNSLQHAMQHHNKWSPLFMTALAVPLYASPLNGMMKIGLMFDHGNSIGAAFVLFALGIGSSLGTLAWLLVDFGWRRVLLWFAGYVLLVLALAYVCEPLLYDSRKAEADHTHAFDDYSCPFPPGTPDAAQLTAHKLHEKFGPLERPTVYGFLAFLVLGVGVRWLDRRGRLERWLTQPRADRARSKWDVNIPGPILGALALVGLIAFSVIGAFIYYPDRDYCVEQMNAVYAEAAVAVKTGKKDEAIRHLEQWDLWVRKLEVGIFLRRFGVTKEQAEAAEALREVIEEIRDELLADNLPDANTRANNDLRPAFQACKAAFPSE